MRYNPQSDIWRSAVLCMNFVRSSHHFMRKHMTSFSSFLLYQIGIYYSELKIIASSLQVSLNRRSETADLFNLPVIRLTPKGKRQYQDRGTENEGNGAQTQFSTKVVGSSGHVTSSVPSHDEREGT